MVEAYVEERLRTLACQNNVDKTRSQHGIVIDYEPIERKILADRRDA